MKLKDKVAIITGAASGIGKATAFLFAKEGAKVVVADINEKDGKKVAKDINIGDAIFVKCDVTKADEIKKMVDAVLKKFGKIDILVNNAGVYWRGTVEEMDEEKYSKLMDINLKGPFLCSKYVIPAMKKNNYGIVINIASDLGISPEPKSPAYCASKAGLISLTKSMALAYAKNNIRANAICPGPIDTSLLRNSFTKKELEEYIKNTLIGRLGNPEEVAKVALFLASDDSSYVNGAAYSVNAADVV